MDNSLTIMLIILSILLLYAIICGIMDDKRNDKRNTNNNKPCYKPNNDFQYGIWEKIDMGIDKIPIYKHVPYEDLDAGTELRIVDYKYQNYERYVRYHNDTKLPEYKKIYVD